MFSINDFTRVESGVTFGFTKHFLIHVKLNRSFDHRILHFVVFYLDILSTDLI